MTQQPSAQNAEFISGYVPKDMATAGSGFNFALPVQLAKMSADSPAVTSVTTVDGHPLPSWLTFNPETKVLSPLQLSLFGIKEPVIFGVMKPL